jgi:hypothetical protein
LSGQASWQLAATIRINFRFGISTAASYACPGTVVERGPIPIMTAVSSGPDRGQVVLRLLMLVAILAIPVVVGLQAGADYDAWWHLRVGEWVVNHGDVPANDPFSSYGQERTWVAYSWLFEVVLYVLYCWIGLWGMLLYQAVMAILIVLSLHRFISRRERHFVTSMGIIGVVALAMAMIFQHRPWMCTILFTIWTLDVVIAWREGTSTWRAWLLPVVFVLWANIHIQFVYGLFVLALGCAAPLFDRRLGWQAETAMPANSARWWKFVTLSVLCFAATFINPYQAQLYGVIVEYATYQAPFRLVNELRALEFRHIGDWAMLALAGGAVFALGRRRHLSSFDILLLTASAFFAFRARRELWFLSIVSAYVLATTRRGNIADADRMEMSPSRWCWVGAAVLLTILVTCGLRGLSTSKLEAAVAERFPVSAARHIRESGYEGPLYNDFNWGGYLIWALPELPVAMDGRTNLHGDDRLVQWCRIWAGAPEWRDDPDLARANVILADSASPLTSLLMGDHRFVEVYRDDIATVFIARKMETGVAYTHRHPGLD